MANHLNRRRFIGISCAAAGLSLLPFHASAASQTDALIWQGYALGAPAKIILHHSDKKAAQALLRQVQGEIARLEDIFSLYRPDSELAVLNRSGALVSPSPEMVDLLERCHGFWQQSGGVFDPTIQPLWTCLARHFSSDHPSPAGPSEQELQKALALTGFDAVRFNKDRIVFTRPEMAITLNGVAQGYITDRITQLLSEHGVTNTLINLGEYRTLDNQPDGTLWQIGIADLETDQQPDQTLELSGNALATSGGAGFRFDPAGHFNHLLNPKAKPDGDLSSNLYQRLTVVAPDATSADAWATAFSLMEPTEIRAILQNMPATSVYVKTENEGFHMLKL
ncbi:FAD:protein FMN transferase [Pseudochrobactrum sp. sp1633]|uniref:FAD:protein FMN transferase n=1 Tax=Pseudochrobactrum sp. sp1633 TaxID=3036706 RepID=UPI0025A5E0BE|nr:FAD:protein FMN transferase [Pseudochrobactrum sp. sp1633]MDM8346057.1 FAD:protein FMN transferase [Pseudochrobactrum sp. sp1633]HWD13877.1 FAD:protein FMN transferase [Pseudochrobactrum sp.]